LQKQSIPKKKQRDDISNPGCIDRRIGAVCMMREDMSFCRNERPRRDASEESNKIVRLVIT